MTGYAVYEWTLPIEWDGEGRMPAPEVRTLLVELSDSAINPMLSDLSIPRDLNVSDARLIGAINLSQVRWASFGPRPGRHDYIRDGHAELGPTESEDS